MKVEIIHETDLTVYRAVGELGVERLTMDLLAKLLRYSRTTFYRRYPNRKELLTEVHQRTIGRIDRVSPRGAGDRRLELEEWWAAVMAFFRTPHGRAFLAIRPCVATIYGMHEVEFYERELLTRLSRWLGDDGALLRMAWALVLSASCHKVDPSTRLAMREVLWSLVSSPPGESVLDDEVDWVTVRSLSEPIFELSSASRGDLGTRSGPDDEARPPMGTGPPVLQ